MTYIITTPTRSDTRSVLADWIELEALISENRRSIPSILSNMLDLSEDNIDVTDSWDAEATELLDEDIVETNRDLLFQSILDEFDYRLKTVGTSYPFIIDRKNNLTTDFPSVMDDVGKLVYLCCLLGTCLRRDRIAASPEVTQAKGELPGVFQICACLAAGGFTLGEVVSFGFPRPDATGFLSALQLAFQRFKAGTVVHKAPVGVSPFTKDGGIDIIAWLDHPDAMPSKLYVLGQCASGANWRTKSVIESQRSFHGNWFSRIPSLHFTPAMFIPFFSHDEIDESQETVFLDLVSGFLLSQELSLGIIFDRGRMAHFAKRCIENRDMVTGIIDSLEQVGEVSEWVLSQVNQLKENA